MLGRLLRMFAAPAPPPADPPPADPPRPPLEPPAADPPEGASEDWSEILSGVEEPAAELEPVEEAHEDPPAPPPAAAPGAELALAVSVMRAAPDVRYRAARSLGLFDGLDGSRGVELERALLANAQQAGKLEALEEAVAQ
jgi:hypothetical protein